MIALDVFDAPELNGPRTDMQDIHNAMAAMHVDFEAGALGNYDYPEYSIDPTIETIAVFTGIENATVLQALRPSLLEQAQIMLDGFIDCNGNQTLGLNELSGWKRSVEYWEQNTRQQAGYAAEIVSTAKENILAKAEGSGITTFRADDRPDLGFSKNDPYVDKIRVNAAGEIVDRIQTKFVGNNGNDWVKIPTVLE